VTRLLERPRITLIVLLVLGLTLVTVSFRSPTAAKLGSVRTLVADVVDPIRGAIDAAFRPFATTVRGAVDYSQAEAKLRQLEAEVSQAKLLEREHAAAYEQLTALSRLLHLPWVGTIPTLPAEVIATTPSNLQLSFVIDRGSAAGVQVGNPVVGDGGLAGRVIAVTPSTATVLEITDPTSVVGVRLPGSGQIGAMSGEGASAPLSVSLIAPGTPLRRGAILTTSGLQGGLFPPGIPAARVVSVSNPLNALQEEIEARPLVDYGSVSYVDVLRWTPAGGGA
jgi:rod shape-determining protein MreC